MKNIPILLLCFFCALFPSQVCPQEQKSQELFSQAYALFSQGNFVRAEERFRKTLSGNFLLEDYSLYFLGLISSSRGQLENSRQHFLQLKQKFPQSFWSAQADLELARLSLAEANYQQAVTELRALRVSKVKKDISDEALYLLGSLHELLGKSPEAYSLYQELRRASPLSPWARMARKEVNRMRVQYPDLFGLNTAEALSGEGGILSREREYQEGEKIYRQLLDLVPAASRPRALMALANLLRAARKREEAIPLLTEIIDKFPGSPEAPAALYRLGEIYWNRDDDMKALDYFKHLRERYSKSSFNDLGEIASARIYESLGKPQDALRLYRGFSKRFPDSPMRDEARWRLAWIHYLQGDYDRARAAFQRVAADKEESRYRTGALYWQARSAQKMGRTEEAKQIFLRILSVQEESYYKGPSARWLEKLGMDYEEKKAANSNPLPEAPASADPDRLFHLARAQELAQLSLHPLAIAELDEIRNAANDDLPMKLTLMRQYARNGAYARSVALANQVPLASDELNRYRYPLAFWAAIQKIAQERNLDPYLVLALIRQESVFDPKALSPAAAFGLMQLLPSTAVHAATRLGLPPPQPENLYEPELNLTLGTHYLKELLQRYANNPVKAIAAYNAGENAVARWEKQIAAEDEEEFIERIPYTETRQYVKLVLRNHRIYRKMYEAKNQKPVSE